MTENRAGGASRRPSAGVPTGAREARMAELEARLDRLEREPGMEAMRKRGRALMRRVMPSEASHHFRNAAREQLLGFRAIVDFWISRVDAWDPSGAAGDDDRTSIEIE